MTDAPERIWAFYSDIFGAMWTPTEDAGAYEYIRADLTPTLAQALTMPEVQALVEAVKALLAAVDNWAECAPGSPAEFVATAHIAEGAEQARAALRKVEGEQ